MKDINMKLAVGTIVTDGRYPLSAMPLFELNHQIYNHAFFGFNIYTNPTGFDPFQIDEIVFFSHVWIL